MDQSLQVTYSSAGTEQGKKMNIGNGKRGNQGGCRGSFSLNVHLANTQYRTHVHRHSKAASRLSVFRSKVNFSP